MLKRSDKSKSLYGSRENRLGIVTFVFVIFLLLALVVFCFCFNGEKLDPQRKISNSVDPESRSDPTVENQNGTNLIWNIPKSPKAVLFIAHGCQRKAYDFWERSLHCQECTGLPEELRLVRFALARGFAVLTVSSVGKCWSLGKERKVVEDVISSWAKKHELDKLPLVALGASSGGYFVSALAKDMRFSSIVVMIAEGVFDQISIGKSYPPTLFVHMPKDVYRQQKIREFLEGLKTEGVDAAEIECFDLPLSSSFLSDRIHGLGLDVSAKVFKLFQDKGFVDEKGFMKRDGRRTPWKQGLSEYGISLEQSFVTPVEEELNLAYAYHEMTSVESEQIFNWFESHMR
ncbi:unnamed protein product [Cochlearia groenlandica]